MKIHCTLDPRTDKVLALLIAALWAAITLFSYLNSWAPDLSAIYFAGHFYGLEAYDQVYASPVGFFGPDNAPAWQAAMDALGRGDESYFPFVYPPIWAALAAPLAHAVDPITFFNIFLVAHILMMSAAVFLSYRIAKPSFPLAWWAGGAFLLLFGSLPSVHALMMNQPQITVVFLAILAMERVVAGKSIQAGAALGLAAAIKLTPIFLVLVFLLRCDWRAIIAFALTSGSLGLASFAIAGPELHWIFLEKLGIISDQIAVIKVNYAVENLVYQVGTLLSGHQIGSEFPITQFPIAEPGWVSVVTRAAFVAVLALIVTVSLRLDRDDQMRIAPVALMLAASMFGPLAWAHHYLFAILLLPTLFVIYPLRPAVFGVTSVFVLTTTPVFSVLDMVSIHIHIHMIVGVLVMGSVLTAFLAAPAFRRNAHDTPNPQNVSEPQTAQA